MDRHSGRGQRGAVKSTVPPWWVVDPISGEPLEEQFISPLAGELQIFGGVAVLAKAVLDEHSLVGEVVGLSAGLDAVQPEFGESDRHHLCCRTAGQSATVMTRVHEVAQAC